MSLDSRLMMEYEMLRHKNDSELETCALTDQEIQELKVKWMTSLESDHKELFAKIKARDHTQVEKILAEKGTKVEIIPKLGCSPIHYSKLNIANKEDEMGDSPLIMAARVDSRMVEIILKYGGNPNQGNDKENPLSVAANRYDRETITSLLRAGGNLEDAVLKLTLPLRHVSEKEMKENSEAGYCVKPLTVLLTDDVYLKCRFPIKTAFKVCKDIKKIRKVRNEFETEFELLMKEADNFAYEFLDQCDKMTEAKAILSYPVNLLKMAINQKKKQFVSHPFSQQLINERWNGDLNNTLLRGKTIIALKYITSPITLPLLFLKFLLFDLPRRIKFMKSDFTQLLKLTFTPCLCFITDACNYLTFLAIVVCVCIFPSDGKYHLGNLDYLLYYCVLARIINEIDFLVQQGWRGYFRNFWSIVNITIVLLLCVAAIFKGLIHYRVDGLLRKHANNSKEGGHIYYRQLEEHLMLSHQDSMMVNYIYAVTEFILTLRVLGLLEISKSLGTMLIALKYLVIDVLRFGIILLTVIFGTSIAIYSMTISIHQWNKELRKSVATLFDGAENYTFSLLPYNEAHPGGEVKGPDVFETFSDTMRNIMWSTFGLLDVVVGYLVFFIRISLFRY